MFAHTARRKAIAVCLIALTTSISVQGYTPLDNIRAGALADRSPGSMVSDGVDRAMEAAWFARNGIEITETESSTSVTAQVTTQVMATVFDQINLAIVAFHNLLLARAGRAPIVTPERRVESCQPDIRRLPRARS